MPGQVQADPTAAAAVLASPVSSEPDRHVYDLRQDMDSSDAFYAALAGFADQMLSAIERRASPILDAFIARIKTNSDESPRSRGEYAIEFLALGVLLSRYEGAAETTPSWIITIARGIAWAREQSPAAKPLVDWVRAGLARRSLAPRTLRRAAKQPAAIDRLSSLITWLDSTGEFRQEATRLQNWRNYFAVLHPEKATYWLRVAVELSRDFEREADSALGSFTRAVTAFVDREQAHWFWREDSLMRARTAIEYHLNMLAAEVMNRGLRENFLKTQERVVLLPGCMRSRPDQCRAHINGVDMTCTACDPACAINRITRSMRTQGVRVFIVPHSGSFSHWLSRWQQTGVGVTAVACLLNIFPGGLEMRQRGIASQCLALDFPGCRKHWDPEGSPTAVNEPRLAQIATASVDRAPHH